jgi:hypothetical protein
MPLSVKFHDIENHALLKLLWKFLFGKLLYLSINALVMIIKKLKMNRMSF